MSSPEPPPPKLRFTLGQVMIAVAVSALVCAVTMRPAASPGARVDRAVAIAFTLLGFAIGTLTLLMIVRSAVETLFGAACPNCSHVPLMRVAMLSFGYRYYRCTACGWRCKRRPWLTWEDALDPDDEAHYRRRDVAGPPGLVVGRPEDEADWQGTTGALLRSQRVRKSPAGSEAEEGSDQAGSSESANTRETGAPG